MKLLDKPLTYAQRRDLLQMLNGNIARISVSDDPAEIVEQLGFAVDRLNMLAYSRVQELTDKDNHKHL